jgi:hypothetical protein
MGWDAERREGGEGRGVRLGVIYLCGGEGYLIAGIYGGKGK